MIFAPIEQSIAITEVGDSEDDHESYAIRKGSGDAIDEGGATGLSNGSHTMDQNTNDIDGNELESMTEATSLLTTSKQLISPLMMNGLPTSTASANLQLSDSGKISNVQVHFIFIFLILILIDYQFMTRTLPANCFE